MEKTPVNKTSAKKVESTETVTHEQMTDSRVEELMAEKFAMMEANQVILGCTVTAVKKYEGKPKTDLNGAVITDSQGVVQKWADSYYTDITFMGGTDTIRLNEELGSRLESGKRYVAKGRVKLVTPTEGKAFTTIEYMEFERLF